MTESGSNRFNRLKPGTEAAYSALFILLSLICLVPLVFVTILSFSSEASIAREGYRFAPVEWSVSAYEYIWRSQDGSGLPQVLRSFLNSVGITLSGTLLGLTLITTMGYVLSRHSFRLRNAYTVLIFIPMIFSGGILSTYVVNTQLLGLKNSFWAPVLPLCCSSFYIIVMRTFFQETVPEEMVDAGRVDGAGHFRIYALLVLPVSLPALATVGLFLTFTYWNDWYQASLYLEPLRRDLFPLQYLLVNMEQNVQFLANNGSALSAGSGQPLPAETTRMAVVVISVVPIMCIYPLFQKYFVSGLTIGAVKG